MPIGSESDHAPNFAVEIRGRPSDESRVIAILESLTRRYQQNRYSQPPLGKLLSDAVEAIALELVWEGRSVHKIFCDKEKQRSIQIAWIRLSVVVSGIWKVYPNTSANALAPR